MKMNKKGFTIVELVIVIAVIAILAGVLIPTFSGIVTRAQDSAVIQEARNMYTEYVGMHDYTTGDPQKNLVIQIDGEYVAVKNAQLIAKVETNLDTAKTAAGGATKVICKACEKIGGSESNKDNCKHCGVVVE